MVCFPCTVTLAHPHHLTQGEILLSTNRALRAPRDCSLALSRALEALRPDWRGLRVLELGAGLGLVSMTLACLGVRS